MSEVRRSQHQVLDRLHHRLIDLTARVADKPADEIIIAEQREPSRQVFRRKRAFGAPRRQREKHDQRLIVGCDTLGKPDAQFFI